MKLDQLGPKSKTRTINKVTESRFGFSIDYSSLTPAKARTMMGVISEAVGKIRRSSQIHSAERNPKYMEMLMVYEGLDSWMTSNSRRMIREGEMGQAETILAAKDMVDTSQDMIEKIGKMQNEQLPALIDSIRDQIGSEQADQFKATVGQVLLNLSTQLSQAREQFDQAARALTGEGAPQAQAMAMPGDPMGGDPMAQQGAGGDEMAMEPEGDDFAATGAAAGGQEQLGREMR